MVHCRQKAAEVLTRETLSKGSKWASLDRDHQKKKTLGASEDAWKTLTVFCFTVVREIKFGLINLGRNQVTAHLLSIYFILLTSNPKKS